MFITAARLALLEPRVVPEIAAVLAAALDSEMPAYGVADLLTRAHFMGQAAYETEGFQRFEEDLNYLHATAIAAAFPRLASRAAGLVGKPMALANAAYASRGGNGPEASFDGWTFRGRGVFQLTGRANYVACGHALGRDFTAAPDLVATPPVAAQTALWFWKMRGCSGAAEADDADAVTRLINGPAMAGAYARRELIEAAKRIFV